MTCPVTSWIPRLVPEHCMTAYIGFQEKALAHRPLNYCVITIWSVLAKRLEPRDYKAKAAQYL
eukprot:1157901-Pelagomonas_calceolata.AAC.4